MNSVTVTLRLSSRVAHLCTNGRSISMCWEAPLVGIKHVLPRCMGVLDPFCNLGHSGCLPYISIKGLGGEDHAEVLRQGGPGSEGRGHALEAQLLRVRLAVHLWGSCLTPLWGLDLSVFGAESMSPSQPLVGAGQHATSTYTAEMQLTSQDAVPQVGS